MTTARDNSTLVFGMGAPKAGTSWLYDALLPSPDVYAKCHTPRDKSTYIKEIHYFDWLNDPKGTRLRKRDQELRESLENFLNRPPKKRTAKRANLLALRMERNAIFYSEEGDHDAYVNWLAKDHVDEKILMDFTPAYGMLSGERMAEMTKVWPNTKFIFILRDPIDRLWSSARFSLRPSVNDGVEVEGDFGKAAKERFFKRLGENLNTTPHRSNYAATVKNLDANVPADDLLYLFYEDLFTQATFDKVTKFLGITAQAPDFKTVTNPSSRSAIDPESEARALEALKPQYEFAQARFGDALPEKWKTRMKAYA